jgi:hypothetical protein
MDRLDPDQVVGALFALSDLERRAPQISRSGPMATPWVRKRRYDADSSV